MNSCGHDCCSPDVQDGCTVDKCIGHPVNNYHDWPGNPLAEGDVVLDGSGLLWRLEEFAYGPENFALAQGLAYNYKAAGRAVDLAHTFKMERPWPASQKEGSDRYQGIFDSLLLGPTAEELRARKRRFQELKEGG